MTDPADAGARTDVNRANWDAWAAVHGQDDYYDRAGLIAGADSLVDIEWAGVRAAIGAVRDRDVLHVQCHLAFDAVTLARHGARVTGVDFSPVALAKAKALADECGVPLTLVAADVTRLPADLGGRFDLAYATIGVLCWIADIDAWMRSVAGTLRPGGRLLLIDQHPIAGMVAGTDPLILDFPYAFDGPHEYTSDHSYAAAMPAPSVSVQYAHALGEIVTAAVDAGLRVVRLEEHLDAPITTVIGARPDEDGRYRLRIGGRPVPLFFTLIAERE